MLARLKLWWKLKTGQLDFPWEQDARFWVVSLVLHVILLLILSHSLLRLYEPQEMRLVAPLTEALDLTEQPLTIQFDEMRFEEMGEAETDDAAMAESQPQLVDDVNDVPVEINVPIVMESDLQFEAELLDPSADAMVRLPLKGTVGVAVTGATGAVDRITQEIIRSLDERKTTVVWLFDQSASMMSQRAEIRSRFDRIYRELQNLAAGGAEEFKKHGDEPLLTSVYAFGNSFTQMTAATADTDRLLAAIDRIERDDTGLEFVFSAVINVVNHYKSLRRINRLTNDRERNVMIVVVSDEAGEDIERIDEAVELCTRWQVPVYVIGVPAPFGREETMLRWVDPDPRYDQTPQWAPIRQGPESVMSELVKLDYADGDPSDVGSIDSGFGPFGLTRLAYESGGIYFTVHPNRRVGAAVRRSETENYTAHFRHFFDPEAMKPYQPDYVSHRTYMQQLGSNRCRMALVQAAQLSRVGSLEAPVLRFERFDEGQFVRTVSLAQRNAAILEPKLNQLYETLRVGEKSRADEISPRWQAGYDLAYGRVMAQKVRVESYNGMLALIKTRLTFKDPKNNTWTLVPADAIQTGSQMAAMAEKAKRLLQQVVEEHPGTPWAMLAQKELSTPLGWEWRESYTAPPEPPRENPGNNNPMMQANPQPTMNATPPPRRDPPRL